MDRFFDWIKNHKGKAIAIIIAMFIVPMIVVHLLFKWKTDIYLVQADWNSGDVLTYIGGFYSFLGTTILSILAIWQNDVINKKNDEYNKKLQEIEIKLNMPIFDIPGKGQSTNGDHSDFRLSLRNVSPNPALQASFSNMTIYDSQDKMIVTSSDVELSDTVLSENTLIDVKYKNGAVFGKNLKMIFCIEYKDKFYKKHKIKATGTIIDAKNFQPIIFDLIEQEDTKNDQT